MVERENSKPPLPVLQKQLPVLQKPPGYRDPNAPPPKPNPKPPPRKTLPPSFPQRRGRRRRSLCCRRCCCLLTVFLLSLLLLLAVSGALFYLWFKPRVPVFHLQSVQTPLFSVAVRPDGTFLSSKTVARVQATNPNGKLQLSYGPSHARITVDGGLELGSGDYPRFEQRKMNSTTLRFAGGVKGVQIDDGLGSSLKARYRSRRLRVHVEVRTRLGMRLMGWRLGMVGIRVVCDGTLKRLQEGATPRCRINLLNWINL